MAVHMKQEQKSRIGAPRKAFYGIGINDADYMVCPMVNGKRVMCPFYRKWKSMLERCCDPKFHARNPTYRGCTVDPQWHSFMAFREWMMGKKWEGRELDKDIIVPGNKVYSPETCMFVPPSINTLSNDCRAARGKYPQGVTWDKSNQKLIAQIRINGMLKRLGYFPTVAEAEAAYRKAKSDHIFRVAYLLGENEDPRLKPALLRIASTNQP
jgi:hypothetical protein